MWVRTRKKLVNLDQCWSVIISTSYLDDEQPRYTLATTVSGGSNGLVEMETYNTLEDAKEAYTYLHQCLALNAALCDLPTKGAAKL